MPVSLNEHLRRRGLSRSFYYEHRDDRSLFPPTYKEGSRVKIRDEDDQRYPLRAVGRPRKLPPAAE
jgi:hypothetical protein